ncbi:MAG: DUF3467 domain-containing protein [Spirochaetes bacterium]|nr:DUF3467 domain-containing protein [Spirochaetota bacterium]
MEQPKEMKIEIKVDEKDATGHFSNFANIVHSPEEFIIDFLFINPTPPGYGKLVSRVILTPQHAKRLLFALTDNINKYEKVHGEIKIGSFETDSKIVQ